MKTTTLRLSDINDKWIAEQAKEEGTSRNNILQMLINKARREAEAAV